MTTRTRSPNGTTDESAAAVVSEIALAARAAEIRGDATTLTPELFVKLLPLLREPIPAGFIQTLGVVKGKPYESTGIRSVQVQIDRMDNVLTPMWWRETVDYEQDGKLAKVTVEVGMPDTPLFSRSSHGGVNQASTTGNLYKGSYTNAAKVAFARVGPGHEVYVGMVDLDPDVHEPSAQQQAREPRRDAAALVDPSSAEFAGHQITKRQTDQLAEIFLEYKRAGQDTTRLEMKLAEVGFEDEYPSHEVAFSLLTRAQGRAVYEWMGAEIAKALS